MATTTTNDDDDDSHGSKMNSMYVDHDQATYDLRHHATHREGRPTVSTDLPMKTLTCNVTRH